MKRVRPVRMVACGDGFGAEGPHRPTGACYGVSPVSPPIEEVAFQPVRIR